MTSVSSADGSSSPLIAAVARLSSAESDIGSCSVRSRISGQCSGCSGSVSAGLLLSWHVAWCYSRAGLILDPPAKVARNGASITPTTRALGKLARASFPSSAFYQGAPKPPVEAG